MHIRWRGMELPSTLEVDRDSLTGSYGNFYAEPFERGFGASVGNSLRRVLLSSLMGSAVTQIKIRARSTNSRRFRAFLRTLLKSF